MSEERDPYSFNPALQVKTPPAILAPLYSIGREVKGMLSLPLAFFGGVFGTIMMTGGALFALWWFETNAQASDDGNEEDEFQLDFEPGALTKLGVAPTEIPQKAVNEETRTPEEAVEEAVTENE